MKLGILLIISLLFITSCSKSEEEIQADKTQNVEAGKTVIENKPDENKGIIKIVPSNKSESTDFTTIDNIEEEITKNPVNSSINFQESTKKHDEDNTEFKVIDLDKKIPDPKFDIETGQNKLNNTNLKEIKSSFN